MPTWCGLCTVEGEDLTQAHIYGSSADSSSTGPRVSVAMLSVRRHPLKLALYTGRLCQHSQTKAIWSTAACPSTNHRRRIFSYNSPVHSVNNRHITSTTVLIRKGFCFTNTHSQGYGRDLRLWYVLWSNIWVTAQRTLPIQPQCFVLPKLTSVTYISIHIHCMLLWQWYSSHGLWFQS